MRKHLESFQLPAICADGRKGNGAARATVAWHYRHGWAPVAVDSVEAYKWFTLADSAGNADAAAYRAEVAATMTADNIAEAERRVAAWTADAETCEFVSRSAGVQPAN